MVIPTEVSGQVGLGVFFLIGLFGGAHCLGMCGPLVTMYSEKMEGARGGRDILTWHEVRQHALFNTGRTVSYAIIGAVMGGLGTVLFGASTLVSLSSIVRGSVGVVIGIIIVASGVTYALRGTVVEVPGTGRLFRTVHGLITRRVEGLVNGFGILGLGAVHGFLPCPMLYPAFLYAFARASPVEGALSLAVLGAGTFPTLMVYGLTVRSLGPEHRRTLHRVLGVAFVVLGLVTLKMGLMSFGIEIPVPIRLPRYQPL
ncbi:MAG: sulfite exporter TauE/SafE family protein [Halobacteriales archaeon]|nr:sulfite exporter TauE/SafE family protein [Halobacteriales archaeon]